MEVPTPSISFFVKVECNTHSRHRDPKGIYSVEAVEEESIVHTACAAIQVVKDRVAFIEENSDKLTIRVFHPDGSEVHIPTPVEPIYHEHAFFKGRASDYPDDVIFS